MKGFTPTAESHGFRPDLLWSGLRSGLPAIALAQARRAGCRATKSCRSRSESAKLSGAKGLPVGLHGVYCFSRDRIRSISGLFCGDGLNCGRSLGLRAAPEKQ